MTFKEIGLMEGNLSNTCKYILINIIDNSMLESGDVSKLVIFVENGLYKDLDKLVFEKLNIISIDSINMLLSELILENKHLVEALEIFDNPSKYYGYAYTHYLIIALSDREE